MGIRKGTNSKPVEPRFWSRVMKAGPADCWKWTGAKNQRGYGQISVKDVSRKATQVSWEIKNGCDFPKGLHACHSCDNPNCVNPDHIWPGTARENMMDAIKKGRVSIDNVKKAENHNTVKTHCVKGHEFTAANTYITPASYRQCRECAHIHNRKYLPKRRESRDAEKENAARRIRYALQRAARALTVTGGPTDDQA